MLSLGWLGGCSASHTPRENSRPTPLKHPPPREPAAAIAAGVRGLHWIDSETQTLLNNLVESVPSARLLLLVNYRPEYQHGWGRTDRSLEPEQSRCGPVNADEFLYALLGDDASLQPLTHLLIARTEGNPFFLEESVRTLARDRGPGRRAWGLSSGAGPAEYSSPGYRAGRAGRAYRPPASGRETSPPGGRSHRQGRPRGTPPGSPEEGPGGAVQYSLALGRPRSSSMRRPSSRSWPTPSSTL